MPAAEILCFETAEDARRILARFAAENEVASRIEIHGMATQETLAKALGLGTATVVICDVEGAEVELLGPRAVPALKLEDILVELHDFVHPDVESLLRERVAATHGITEIRARPRQILNWTATVQFDRYTTLALLDERRPGGMRWFWMCRRAPR